MKRNANKQGESQSNVNFRLIETVRRTESLFNRNEVKIQEEKRTAIHHIVQGVATEDDAIKSKYVQICRLIQLKILNKISC